MSMSDNDNLYPSEKRQSVRLFAMGVCLLAIIGLIWGGFYLASQSKPEKEPDSVASNKTESEPAQKSELPPIDIEPDDKTESVPAEDEVATVESKEKTEQKPKIEADKEAAARSSLPSLNESDKAVTADIIALNKQEPLQKLLEPREIIRKFVVAVNNASEGRVARKYPPIKPPLNSFSAVKQGGEHYTLDPEGYKRYDTYVNLLASLKPSQLANLYQRFQPLLQEAYLELGEDDTTFETVLVEAIDSILEAPVVEGEIPLVRPSVMYKFADPEMEKLPDLHKLMIRMGPENTKKVKKALTSLKSALEE